MKVGCNLSLDVEVVRALRLKARKDLSVSRVANRLLVAALGLKLPQEKTQGEAVKG